jgi:hypothetical protein
LKFRNVGGVSADPSEIRQFAGGFFDSHETAMVFAHPIKETIAICKQRDVFNACFPNDDSRDGSPFGHWCEEVAFNEDKTSNLERGTYDSLQTSREYRFRAAFDPGAANVGR